MKKKEKKEKPQKPYGLCFRCEHRARYIESSWQGDPTHPRYECSKIEFSAHSCYMYTPVKPVVTVPLDPGDRRPRLGPAMISSREQASVVADCKLRARRHGRDGAVLWWEPKKEKP